MVSAAWDEPDFRHVLAAEEGRARRAGQPFLILVVDARNGGGASGRGSTASDGEAGLADALARCLRESDLVGWHRTDRRAAALLTETPVDPGTARLVGAKVLQGLGAALASDLARKLRVRIYRYGTPKAQIGFHRLFTASGAGDAKGPAAAGSVPLPRRTVAVGGMRLPGRTEI